jgi:DNA mismatch endonuclease (patch repair protein)
MSLVRAKNTKPEMKVRRLVHSLGFRYVLHRGELPGHPDLVFPAKKKVIFVHGCFWHRHDILTCKLTRTPKSNVEFWTRKFEENKKRDRQNQVELLAKGWKLMVIWECELKDLENLKKRVISFLTSNVEY